MEKAMGMPPICEGFAVETVQGLIFTVKGLVHPPDRLIAYLRYLPDPEGDRERDGKRYRRLYHPNEQEKVLQTLNPDGLFHDPVSGIRSQAVFRKQICRVYDPCRRLAVIHQRGPADRVEEDALLLAEFLRESSEAPLEKLGVSGSVLLGLQRRESDIDIVVYGETEGRSVHQALLELLEDPSSPANRPRGRQLMAIHALHRTDTPLSFPDFARHQSRKVNEGYFRGRPYFIRFVKQPAQEDEQYGDLYYENLGSAIVKAVVTDARNAIFTPCRYFIKDVVFLEGSTTLDLQEIISFRGRFCEQVQAGEWAIARGSIEKVVPRSSKVYARLIVGGGSGDYLKSLTMI
ncbi:MAG: nucleotidyltransferase domain-containing protein [Syntrophaceae bacterium]|nr:nucleotidyltransferase domain-containing protein [Syntrophaceae bacterium]